MLLVIEQIFAAHSLKAPQLIFPTAGDVTRVVPGQNGNQDLVIGEEMGDAIGAEVFRVQPV